MNVADSSFDITVVVPAYQAELFLADTLATVARQTARPFELLVVDDGSTDGTCEVVEAFVVANRALSVRLLREAHRGPGATRNAGVRAARSDWIAFLDSDDLWHPSKLEEMQQAMRAHPSANFYCHNETIKALNGAENRIDYGAGFRFDHSIPKQLYSSNRFSTSAVVCRRDLVLRWGGFDEGLSSAQDYELWLRMSPDLVPVFVPQVLGTYVHRDGNITTRRRWKRLLNVLRVRHRHREKAGVRLYAYSVLRDILYYVAAPLRARVKDVLKRGLAAN